MRSRSRSAKVAAVSVTFVLLFLLVDRIDRCRCIDFYQYVGLLSNQSAEPTIRTGFSAYEEERRLER